MKKIIFYISPLAILSLVGLNEHGAGAWAIWCALGVIVIWNMAAEAIVREERRRARRKARIEKLKLQKDWEQKKSSEPLGVGPELKAIKFERTA